MFYQEVDVPVVTPAFIPPRTGLQRIHVFVPLWRKRNSADIVTTIEQALGAIMSQPAEHITPDPKPLRMKWWHIKPRHFSRWTFVVENITDPAGTAAVLGVIYREFPYATVKYVT